MCVCVCEWLNRNPEQAGYTKLLFEIESKPQVCILSLNSHSLVRLLKLAYEFIKDYSKNELSQTSFSLRCANKTVVNSCSVTLTIIQYELRMRLLADNCRVGGSLVSKWNQSSGSRVNCEYKIMKMQTRYNSWYCIIRKFYIYCWCIVMFMHIQLLEYVHQGKFYPRVSLGTLGPYLFRFLNYPRGFGTQGFLRENWFYPRVTSWVLEFTPGVFVRFSFTPGFLVSRVPEERNLPWCNVLLILFRISEIM